MNQTTPMKSSDPLYIFELGREWKLSLAEIESIFGASSIAFVSEKIALVATSLDVKNIFNRMGGVIRALRVLEPIRDAKMFPHRVLEYLSKNTDEGKLSFGLGIMSKNPAKLPLFSTGLRIKKDARASGRNARFVNKDDKNLVSALVKKEKLAVTETEFFLAEAGTTWYIATTIAIQDIDAYAERDMGKVRDMEVGMLPPKLAQLMVNLAIGPGSTQGSLESTDIGLYDPFCGLGTVLIEGANMGITKLFASDVSTDMSRATEKGIQEFSTLRGLQVDSISITLDAKKILDFPRFPEVTHIVTEGYLGSILGQTTISVDRVAQEKRNILTIYETMFRELYRAKFSGTVVMTVPCWDVRGNFIYFNEFFEFLGRVGFEIVPLLANRTEIQPTKYGTLLYRRPGQTVGREVVRIRKK